MDPSAYPSRETLSEMDVGELRQEIERTMSDIDHTIDALKAAASPEALKARAFATVKRRASDMGSRVTETLHSNPIPTAIAVFLLGGSMIWMMRRRAQRAALPPPPSTPSEYLRAWLRQQ